MGSTAEACARDVLETVPLVMRFVRERVRRGGAAGLSLPQFRTLAFLQRSDRPSLSMVAGHLGLSLPAMSRLVGGLDARGLVERRPDPSNRRQITLVLTTRGQATVAAVRQDVRQELAAALRSLPAPERTTVQQAMQALRRTFEPPSASRAGIRRSRS